MRKADIFEMYARLEAQRPAPKGELNHVNEYTLLVAVVLSAQATDVGVNKATQALFAQVTTPEQMVALGEAGLKAHIRTIGLYNAKAKNVIALSHILIEKHASRVPQDRAALEALPGVGRKTANVVLNIAFGQPTIAVDTHIFRVGNRTGLAPRQDAARRRAEAGEGDAGAIQAARPPLADPARPLCLQGAQAGLPVLHRQRPVPLQGQDGVRRTIGGQGLTGLKCQLKIKLITLLKSPYHSQNEEYGP